MLPEGRGQGEVEKGEWRFYNVLVLSHSKSPQKCTGPRSSGCSWAKAQTLLCDMPEALGGQARGPLLGTPICLAPLPVISTLGYARHSPV